MTTRMLQRPERVPNDRLLDLSGKAAIVTGAAAGIGFGIAQRLARAGASITVADLNAETGEAAAKALRDNGGEARFARCDIADETQVKSLVAEAVEAHGGLDILVNNARFVRRESVVTSVLDIDEALWTSMHDVNLKGQFLCAREAGRVMADQGRGGRIINVASVAGFRPANVGMTSYSASKGGVIMLTKALALDLAKHDILVNAIAPGIIVTERSAPGWANPNDTAKRLMQRVALDRLGFPDDIGKAALFFASEMGAYVTGHVLVVDGGNLLY